MRVRWLGLVWLAACGPEGEPCEAARYPPQGDSPYLLPYPVGQTYNVRQGNCNVDNTHNAAHNASFAYDFEMPLGAPVTAARGGQVVEVIDGWPDEDPDPDHGNYVLIRHEDASYAIYGHLARGAAVAAGDRVLAGDPIGRAGDSGLSRGPHLHFAALRCALVIGPSRLGCASVPVSFSNTRAHPRGLEGDPRSALGGGGRYTAEAPAAPR